MALARQILFLLLARDPARYRPLMVPCVLEKLGYGLAVIVLLAQGRVAANTLITAGIDLTFGAWFFAAYLTTPSQAPAVAGST